MAETAKSSQAGDNYTPEERYRYIGFDVFPKGKTSFWKSESEAKEYTSKVVSGIGESVLHREFSLLEDEAMGKADKWVLTAGGATLLLTLVLPWVSFRTATGAEFSMSWPSALGTLISSLGTAFAGGIGIGLSSLLALLFMIGAPVVGAWTLAMVWRKAKSAEAYQLGLRTPLKVGYILFFSGLAVFVLAFFGGHIPGFESWGLIDPPEHYGIGALLSILSAGPYVALGMAVVCAVKSGDL